MGRKAKPTHLRLLEGNREHRPINQDEPIPDGEISREPPAYLSPRQQHYWRETISFAPEGMLKRLDGGALLVYVTALADLEYASVKVEEAGPIIKMPGPSGQFMQNPFVSIKRAAMEKILKAGSELGFTPSSRSRVKVTGKKKGKSAFGKLRELKI